MDREFAWGVGVVAVGLLVLGVLAATGAFADPFASGAQRRPVTLYAAAGAALLVVAGAVTTVRAVGDG
jgi:hypothetical protein